MLFSQLHHAALLALVSAVNAQLHDQVIDTEYGPVKGFKYFNESTLDENWGVKESNVAAFLGIPFAASTAYENRWKPPKPRAPWNETFMATAFGPECPSNYASYISEDCLSVNIWSAANSSDDKLPVIVYNQGTGEPSNSGVYYGGGLARKGLVVVTFNRRDEGFGFLAHPELNAESLAETGYSSSGQYGTLDHLEVLKWVQRNIAKFGGDPNQVTIAGQSFGSAQVYHALNSKLFSGLFHAAIADSGIRYPYDTLLAGLADSYVEMEHALELGVNYTLSHNVSTVAELRKLSVEDLLIGNDDRDDSLWWVTALSSQYPIKYKPTLDGYVIPEKYIDSLRHRPVNDVPLITGNNKDESGAATSTDYTSAEYIKDCTLKYGNLSTEYFKLYPGRNETEASRSWNAAARDTSVISSWAFAKDWIKTSDNPIYTYYWDHAPPNQTQGAYHESEIFYFMDSLYANNYDHTWSWYDRYLGEVLSSYWANFAKTHNPNTGGSYPFNNLTYWAPVNSRTKSVFHIGQSFGNRSLAQSPDQVELIMDYFHQQTPF